MRDERLTFMIDLKLMMPLVERQKSRVINSTDLKVHGGVVEWWRREERGEEGEKQRQLVRCPSIKPTPKILRDYEDLGLRNYFILPRAFRLDDTTVCLSTWAGYLR